MKVVVHRTFDFKFLLRIALATLFSTVISCNEQISSPSDPNQYASLVIYHNWMLGYNMFTTDKLVWGNERGIGKAFSDVGVYFWAFCDSAEIYRLPPYAGGYFPDDDKLLRQYAAANHPGHEIVWHLLYVDRFKANTGGFSAAGRTANLNNGYNKPPSPANERYSFLFWQDIIDAYPSQDDQKKIAVTVTVHELGHQRAGLSDVQGPDGQPQFHNNFIDVNGDYVRDAWCVMDYLAPLTLNPVFCYDNSTDTDTTNSCKDNLIRNFGNF